MGGLMSKPKKKKEDAYAATEIESKAPEKSTKEATPSPSPEPTPATKTIESPAAESAAVKQEGETKPPKEETFKEIQTAEKAESKSADVADVAKAEENTIQRKISGAGSEVQSENEGDPGIFDLVKGEEMFLNYTQLEIGRLCNFFEELCDDEEGETMSKSKFCEMFPTAAAAMVEGVKLDKQQELKIKTIDRIFMTFDQNKDSKLDLKEFLSGFSYWHNQVGSFKEILLVYFKLFDAERMGLMKMEGFKSMIEHMVAAEAATMQKMWAEQNTDAANDTDKVSADISTFVNLVFESVDEDNSGEIDFEEFKGWVEGHTAQAMMLGDSPESLLKSFKLFDIDGSGTINREEFGDMLLSTHNGSTDLQDMSSIQGRIDLFATKVFKVVDEDESGEIAYDEFEKWVEENSGRAETVSEAGDVIAEITQLLRKAANVMQSSKNTHKGVKKKKSNNVMTRKGSIEGLLDKQVNTARTDEEEKEK